MGFYDDFMAAFEKAVEDAGNLNKLARLCGINYPSLQRWYTKKQVPNLQSIEPLLPFLNLTSKMGISIIKGVQTYSAPQVVDEDKAVKVPVMAEVGAGIALEVWEQEPIEYISIMPEYMREGLRVFKVSGDSMSPTIKRGAYVGVTPLQDIFLKEGQIYLCYNPPFGIVVKRVRPAANNCVLLLSDNPDYEPIKINLDEYQKVVLGEVRWVMQSV